ncbi:MAG: sigma-70 family RNA polymerase sigma factor [Ignavibacteriaceae bacterium]
MENEDNNLVNRCLNGDVEAYSALVEKYQKIIFRLAHKILKNYDDAEEITQTVFVKAYENLNKYNPKYKFFSWLYRITINETLNFSKKKSYSEEINDNIYNIEDNPGEAFDRNDLGEKIQDALMELDMLYRLPVVLKHFLNYSYKELGDLLGIPEKTVKSRLFTGRQLLKDILIKKSVFEDD